MRSLPRIVKVGHKETAPCEVLFSRDIYLFSLIFQDRSLFSHHHRPIKRGLFPLYPHFFYLSVQLDPALVGSSRNLLSSNVLVLYFLLGQFMTKVLRPLDSWLVNVIYFHLILFNFDFVVQIADHIIQFKPVL